MELLLLGPGWGSLEQRLSAAGFVLHRAHKLPGLDAILAQSAGVIRGIITYSGCTQVDDALLARLPALGIIANLGVGYESVDADAARARGVAVTNGAGANAPDVAELTIGLMLAVTRKMVEADRYVRSGKWLDRRMALTTRMTGKRLGLLGIGSIGRAVGQLGAAFSMDVAYCARKQRADLAWRFEPDLAALAESVDYLIAAVPDSRETRGMVSARVLEALGAEGILISVGRGPVVDEAALVAALQSGALGGAGLDVFDREPEVPEALLTSDRVVLSPHMGGATRDSIEAGAVLAVANLEAFAAGKKLLTPV